MLEIALPSLELSLEAAACIGAAAVAPAAGTLAWTSGTAVYNPTFTLTGILLGDIVSLEIHTVSGAGPLYGSDTNTVDATEAEDGALTFPGIPTLGYGTTYYALYYIIRGGVTSAASNVVSKAMDAAPATTWDAANKSTYITLSGSNLIATGTAGVGAPTPVLGSRAQTTGKRYFEVAITPAGAFSAASFGLANTLPANFANPGATANAISRSLNGTVTFNGSTVGTEASHDTTAVIVMGVAIDADADKVWFSKANSFSGSPSAGTGGYSVASIATYYMMFASYGTGGAGDIGTLRRKASEFTYTPPTGFTGWDD